MSLENTTDIHWLNYLHNIRSPDFQNRHGVGSFRATSCFSLSFQGLTRKRTPQLSVTMGWALLNRPTWQLFMKKLRGKNRWTMGFLNQIAHGIGVEIDRNPPPSVKMRKSHGFQWWKPVKALYFMGKTRENPMVSYFPGIFLRVTHGFPRAARLVTMSPLSPSTFSLSKVVSRCPMLLADLDWFSLVDKVWLSMLKYG